MTEAVPPEPEPESDDLDPLARLRTTSDPRELRALAHPVRMALYEAFGIHTTLTATQASKIVGGTPTSVAYHLRTLAKYGYVVEAEGADGRERPWRLRSIGIDFSRNDPTPGMAAAAKVLGDALFQSWLDRRARYEAGREQWSAEVRDAVSDLGFILFGTLEEFTALKRDWARLFMRYYDRIEDPSLRPEGSMLFELKLFTQPIDTTPVPIDEET